MVQWSPEPWNIYRTASLETTVGLTEKVFDHLDRVLRLNLDTMKATLRQSEDSANKALVAKEVQDSVAVQVELFRWAVDCAANGQHREAGRT